MHQLTHKLKTGELKTVDTPFPAHDARSILVRNHFSVVSAGTEGKRVHDARLGYIGKARARKKELNQAIGLVKTNGLKQTYRVVSNKLDMPSALGYSCAGKVLAVGSQIRDIQVGDYVACGGDHAVHAEVVSVPRNLCAKIPEAVSLKHAAFSSIAAIAVQGVRQARLGLGENGVVIGLGLVGQLTLQLLNSAGARTVGVDLQDHLVKLAEDNGATLALARNRPNLVETILEFTRGFGTDAVIITAGTSSLDPVELAGCLCRQKGRVVVVGNVPTGFSRPNYYKKEIDLHMSCSYGPGRYDPQYEEKGFDYPIGYVRWTENRNMQAFLQLLADGKLNLDKLITHTFSFERAEEAYELILNKSERFVGCVLEYNGEKPVQNSITVQTNGQAHATAAEPKIGFIGAGSFAQNALLPTVKKHAELVGVATANGNTARYIADKYGFQYCTCNADDILNNDQINTLFIATRHNLHAEYVIRALKAGKNVFVEKPLALTIEELEEIKDIYLALNHFEGRNGSSSSVESGAPKLMVGYNRRFAPFIQQIKQVLPEKLPKAINYRINAGAAATDHWIHDPDTGGGRIIGEVCHFVDLAMFLSDGVIESVSATAMRSQPNLQDTLVLNLSFDNGSVASISYFSNGSKKLEKEHLEIFCGNQVAIVDDFKEFKLYGPNKSRARSRQDKGYSVEIHTFLESVKRGKSSPISFAEIYQTSLASFKILESIQTRQTVHMR